MVPCKSSSGSHIQTRVSISFRGFFIARGQKLKLENGMIIALEPKIIYPGRGVVGIENTHLVTDAGLEPLTKFSDEVTVLPVAGNHQ